MAHEGLRAHRVYGGLPAGFYGLDAMLVEGVLRCLVGEPRDEGATRIDPWRPGPGRALDQARPVFHPAARVGLAGLFLAVPALEATGCILRCVRAAVPLVGEPVFR